MKILGIGALAVVSGLSGAAAVPVSAQTACQQIQVTTTRTASPVAVTPLDAIAFPVPLTPAVSTVTREILVCPPGTTLPPAPAPVLIGAPVSGTPVFETPVLAPVVGVPYLPIQPAVPPAAAGTPASAPPPPAMVGAVPQDTVRALATQGARFDRVVVTVAGTAAAIAQATDARGAPITTFRLEAQGASVGVVVWGRAPVRAGETVRVSGPFYVSTPFVGSSGTPWHDAIEAELLER